MTAADELIRAACVPVDGSPHRDASLNDANQILARDPGLALTSIHVASALGDLHAVRRLIEEDPRRATVSGGPYGWTPLTCLCFSRFLLSETECGERFVETARLLLAHGADPNDGWWDRTGDRPVWEPVIYGAAGIARNVELTKLLLEHGADPNDEETPYHAPEGWDNAVLEVLAASGRMTEESLATALLRKVDWHDPDGGRLLLDHGASPSVLTRFGRTALHQAVLRESALSFIEALLDHGADPTITAVRRDGGRPTWREDSAMSLAARMGRGDVIDEIMRRGLASPAEGFIGLLGACARQKKEIAVAMLEREPALLPRLATDGPLSLVRFASWGNRAGVEILLDLGVPVDAPLGEADDYFDLTKDSTALHAAAWRARTETIEVLVRRGADLERADGKGRTALMLAVRACVDSCWTARRTPDGVALLLAHGAMARSIAAPTGYGAIDSLLESARETEEG